MFSHRSAGKPVLIADVGDGSIGISMVTLGETAEVLRSMRATLPIEDRTREQSAAAIIKLLEESLGKILGASGPGSKPVTPHAVHIVMRAPWTRFRTTSADERFEEARTITKEVIADQAKKALASPSELDRNSILEAGVLQVFLNGYPTANPIGKRAKSISVVAFESDIDAGMRSSIVNAFGKALPDRVPAFHSGMRSLLTVMHEHLPDIHRFLLIDIGGTQTSCAVVRKDAVTQYVAANEGLSTILKRIAQGGMPEETLSLLRMLATDACSTSACQAVKDSLAKAEPELVRAFGEVFTTLAATRRLPNACMLSAPAELTPWLQGFFERIDFSQFTATTQPLLVETLSPEHLLDSVHWQTGVVPDAGLGIAASSVNILERKS
jgi:hypothetical protein